MRKFEFTLSDDLSEAVFRFRLNRGGQRIGQEDADVLDELMKLAQFFNEMVNDNEPEPEPEPEFTSEGFYVDAEAVQAAIEFAENKVTDHHLAVLFRALTAAQRQTHDFGDYERLTELKEVFFPGFGEDMGD